MQTVDIQSVEKETQEFAVAILAGAPVEISSKEAFGRAGDVVKALERHSAALEAKRKEYTAPLDETKKKIKADFDRMREPLEAKAGEIRNQMLKWQREEQARLDAEQKRIDEEALAKAKKENVSEVVVPIVNEQAKTTRGAMTTSTVRKIWKWEVLDGRDVPCEFHIVDAARITQAVRDGRRSIPGVRIYEEESLSVR